jgi:hypothetical protein
MFSQTSSINVDFNRGRENDFKNSAAKFSFSVTPDKNSKNSADDQKKIEAITKHFEKNQKFYLHVFFVSWIPVAALFLWLLFGYRKFSFGETLILSAYLSALSLFLTTLNELLTWFFPNRIDAGYGIFEIFSFGFYYFMIRRMYYRSGKSFNFKFIVFLFLTLIFYISVIASVVMTGVLPFLKNL